MPHLSEPEYLNLLAEAQKISESAYVPYSGYKVGAVVLTRTGNQYSGANVENASYGGTICAERSAIIKMANAGDRDIAVIAVHTPNHGYPCGLCLQVIREFSPRPEATEIVIIGENGLDVRKLKELAPFLWSGTDL